MYKLYNGCPNDELADLWRRQDKAREHLSTTVKELFGDDSRARVTWFPMEGKWSAAAWIDGKYHELTKFFDDLIPCVEEAVRCLETMKDCR